MTTATETKLETRRVSVMNGALDITVRVTGSGEPLLFLHAAAGLHWDGFLTALAEHYTVYSPLFPGCDPEHPDDIQDLHGLWDAVLAYEELADALGLEQFTLVGHSFGGMLACEVAAQLRSRVRKLVLIAPIGLWRDDAPYTVADWCAVPPEELPGVLFHRLDAEPVREFLTPPADEKEAALQMVDFIWALGCTGKIVWPIPDKGLSKRIHRVTAPTLIVWGENDNLIPAVYAEAFADALSDAKVCMIAECGHEPPLEQCEELTREVEAFLDG